MFRDNCTHQSFSRTILTYGLCLLLCGAIFSSLVFHTEARAGSISYSYGISFGNLGDVPADNGAPFGDFTFDDGGSAGTVTLTINVAATVGSADVAQIYFNLDSGLDATSLSFARQPASTGPTAADTTISTGDDAFMADGDGLYDIWFELPPGPGPNAGRFNAGETLIYVIDDGIIGTLVAADFDVVSAPGPSGGAGPFLSAVHFVSTGPQGKDSDWVGAVPEPSTLILLGLGSLALVVRRKGPRA